MLFDRDIKTIGKQINNALNEELDNSAVAKFATTAKDGNNFKKWATSVLKDYMIKGYIFFQKRL